MSDWTKLMIAMAIVVIACAIGAAISYTQVVACQGKGGELVNGKCVKVEYIP